MLSIVEWSELDSVIEDSIEESEEKYQATQIVTHARPVRDKKKPERYDMYMH